MADKWEYKIVERVHAKPIPDGETNCCPLIQSLGAEGWELITVIAGAVPAGVNNPFNEWTFLYWFKRKMV